MDTKKLLISLFISINLIACSSSSTENIIIPIEPLAASKVCCNDFSQFPWIQLNTTENLDFQLDSSSPIGHFIDGNSYFNAFKLAEQSSKVKVQLSSFMINKSVIAPKLVLLDDKFNIANTIDLKQFEVKVSGVLTRTQFQLNVDIDASKTPYFIVYSSDDYLGQSIKVKHPARIRAEELGEPMPMVTDPTYAYHRFGKLKLSVKTISLQAYKVVTQKTAQTIIHPQPETKLFYQNAIKKAVKANNITKALSLLEEAKKLGIKDAESVFINAFAYSHEIDHPFSPKPISHSHSCRSLLLATLR